MNKPQYLAELSNLLIFMTRADREQVLARYGALFDSAGPGGEKRLLARLGSPTAAAIRLNRIYDTDGYEDGILDSLEAEFASGGPEAAPAPVQDAPSPVADAEKDLPEYDLSDLPELSALPDTPEPPVPAAQPPLSAGDDAGPDLPPAGEEAPVPDVPAVTAGKNTAPADEADEDLDGYEDLDEDEDDGVPLAGPVIFIERTMPLGVGIPLFILSILLLAIPLAAALLLVIPALALPGLAVLLGAWLAVVGGLWCISIIADAAMLFGLALILLAAGLVVLWLGLWLDVLLVTGYSHAIRGLAHLTLGKKVTGDA